MPLTADQQAELERLQAEASKPVPRTETGVAGVLHAVLDSLSGVVPHRAPEAWDVLHGQVEDVAGGQPEAKPDKPDKASSSSSSSSSLGKDNRGAS